MTKQCSLCYIEVDLEDAICCQTCQTVYCPDCAKGCVYGFVCAEDYECENGTCLNCEISE